DNTNWIVSLSKLTLGRDHNAVLGVLSPSEDVFAKVNEHMRTSLIIALFGIAAGLLAAWLVAYTMAKPIGKLTEEAFRMKEFDLEEREPVHSMIIEVRRLSQAVDTLKRSLKDFARYVPAQVVRRLVAGEMTSEIGGDRTQITVLFTDIADFTSISESMEPKELMADISEYLAIMSQTLIENGATIDKYIGDAVMAIWNAPVPQHDHAELACKATLEVVSAIAALNERRTESGKAPFNTRFGLHTGEAVVGNVGSAERMNYTALGETVNLAARLESLNKQMGTMILISETVYQEISGTYPTRIVEMVRPKGASHAVRVYELLTDELYGLNHSDAGQHLESWQKCHELYAAHDWEQAVQSIDRHIERYPEDKAAVVIRKRADSFKNYPPPDDWDGIFTAQEK
ncbi:MAG: adenylate/guanylate cyclase domain-containing protein, partial [Desulfobulbia bacterium]